MIDAREAKRGAHEWSRAIRRRPASKASSAVKLVASVLADRATLVTAALAEEHGLPSSTVGQVATWPSVAMLAEDLGQGSERTVRGFLAVLEEQGDVLVTDRRHRRLASVYVLAESGRPVGSDQSSERLDPTADEEATGRSQPVAEVGRPVEVSRSNEATGRIRPEGDRLDPTGDDRLDPTGPYKEEPIIEPIKSKLASLLWSGWKSRYRERVGVSPPGEHRAQLEGDHAQLQASQPLVDWVLENASAECSAEQLAERLLAGFWSRADLVRPEAWWLAKDPVRALGLSAGATKADAQRKRVAELKRVELERERITVISARPPPAEARAFLRRAKGES